MDHFERKLSANEFAQLYNKIAHKNYSDHIRIVPSAINENVVQIFFYEQIIDTVFINNNYCDVLMNSILNALDCSKQIILDKVTELLENG